MVEDSFICSFCEDVYDVKYIFDNQYTDDIYCDECGASIEQQMMEERWEARNDRD